jgi:hypothetical protein
MPQQLQQKEASLFRSLVKLYESKQHKKGKAHNPASGHC